MPPLHNANALHDKIHVHLKEWKILKKVFTITLDNARANNNMQDIFHDTLNVYARLACANEIFIIDVLHVLKSIMKKSMKSIDVEITKVKESIIYENGSEDRKRKFENCFGSWH